VKLKPVGLTALESVPELDLPATETNAVMQIDLSQQKVPPGTHAFALQGSAQGKQTGDDKKTKDVTVMFYSEPVVLKVKPVQTAKQDAK
jgi:hypothetical protein